MRAVLLQNDAEARCPTVGRAERKNSRVVRNISDGAFCGFQLDRSPYIYSTINNTGFLPLNIGYGDPKYPRGHNEFDNQLKVERQMRAAYQNHLYEDHEKRRLIVELLELQGRPTAQQRTPTLSDTLLRSPKRLARLSPSVYHPIKPYSADTRGHLEATAPLISMMQVSGGPRSSTAHPSISAPLQQSFHSKDLLQSSMRAVDHVNTPVGDLSLVMESLANPRPNSALTMASHGSSAQLSAMRSNAPSLRSGTPDIRSRGNSRLHSARDRLTHNNSAEDYSSAVLHGVDVMPPLQCTTKKRVHIFRDFANNGRVAAMSALTSESFLVEAAENGDAPLPSRVTSPAAPVARNSSTPSFREDEYMCDERLARLVRVSHAKKVGAM